MPAPRLRLNPFKPFRDAMNVIVPSLKGCQRRHPGINGVIFGKL